jgi:hypothetical protein
MDELVKNTVAFLKQEYGPGDSVLASKEDVAFFQEKTPSKEVVLEPVVKPVRDNMNEIASLVAKAAPELRLREEIPDDSEARKIGALWQEQLKALHVAVIAFGESGPSLQFLQNVAKAIDTLITPAKIIEGSRFEKEKKWDLFFTSSSLKLVIAPDFATWKGTRLASMYKEHPASSSHTLANIPLLPLKSITHLLKNPSLKKELWKTIVSLLSS